MDQNGNPIKIDNRIDFSNFYRFIRKRSDIFFEGTSFEDENATYMIEEKKGKNAKNIWIRKDVLDRCLEHASFAPKKTLGGGMLYFIQEVGKFNRFKIGYTTTIAKRLDALQVGNPDKLVVYKKIENVSRTIEKQVHECFAKHHIRSEWFAITPEDIEHICASVMLLNL